MRSAVLAAFAVIGTAVLVLGLRAIDVTSPDTAVLKINRISRGFTFGDSSWRTAGEFGSFGEVLAFFPIGAFTALFRPLPGEAIEPAILAVPLEVENLLLLLLTLAGVWGARRRPLKDPLLQWAVLFIVAWTSIYAFLSYNFGSLARFKLQVLPLLLGVMLYLAIPPSRLASAGGPTERPAHPRGRAARLLFVVNDGAYFLSHRLPLAKAAAAAGYDVHVAFPPHEAARRIKRERLTYHPVPITRRGTNPLREARTVVALWRLYRRVRPDLVHHLTIKPILYGGIAARLARVPSVVHAVTGLGHVFVASGARARALRRIVVLGYRAAFAHPRCTGLFQNPDDASRLQAEGIVAPGRSVIVRGSGVDMRRFAPAPEPRGAPVVVLASRLIRPKGVEDFVEAARILRARGSRARLVIVGDTDPGNPQAIGREELEAWAKEGAVEWWGLRRDMASVFARAHVACLPSYYGEGVPKVLIEAAACGRAIVTTDTPGCREIVRDGDNGLLVPPREPAALADAIERLATNPARRRAMGARGRELATREFSLDAVNRATLALYADLLGQVA